MSLALTPLIFNLGPTELIIILVIVLLLFGGSRLAGLGKSSGRALKEFKEETKGLRENPTGSEAQTPSTTTAPPAVTNGQVTNGQVDPSGQNWQQPPSYQQAPAPQPNNLADPAAPDARRDV